LLDVHLEERRELIGAVRVSRAVDVAADAGHGGAKRRAVGVGAVGEAVERAAIAEGARWRRMPSGAGHDAMLVGRHVPTGMIFVPSRDGISHSPEEYTSPDQLELGTRVLAAALRDLLRTGG
jgi:acetylornithine deacetylase/succinyl-diaminopimelate desuccinylase-like protein